MAITFQEQIKRQKRLIFIFLGVLVAAGIFIGVWYFYMQQETSTEEVFIQQHFKKIKIDFEVLDNPLLKELQPIEKIPDFEGELGRENPFVPYLPTQQP